MLSIMKVMGESLSPSFHTGDFILVGRAGFLLRRLKPDDVIIFRHPDYGVLVKRVQSISTNGEELFVVGDHPDSTDSRAFGPVPRSRLIGKVLWHIAQ